MKKKNQGEHKRGSKIQFVKSSFCSELGCIELGKANHDEFHLKDTKTNKVLIFDRNEVAAFFKSVKGGEFDHLLS